MGRRIYLLEKQWPTASNKRTINKQLRTAAGSYLLFFCCPCATGQSKPFSPYRPREKLNLELLLLYIDRERGGRMLLLLYVFCFVYSFLEGIIEHRVRRHPFAKQNFSHFHPYFILNVFLRST